MTIDSLGRVAADVAMKAAVSYVHANRAKMTNVGFVDVLLNELKVACKAAVGPALDDAKEAILANMPEVAEATFLASMRLAGIGAAKRALTIVGAV